MLISWWLESFLFSAAYCTNTIIYIKYKSYIIPSKLKCPFYNFWHVIFYCIYRKKHSIVVTAEWEMWPSALLTTEEPDLPWLHKASPVGGLLTLRLTLFQIVAQRIKTTYTMRDFSCVWVKVSLRSTWCWWESKPSSLLFMPSMKCVCLLFSFLFNTAKVYM